LPWKNTYTASAAPQRILEFEKYLSPPFFAPSVAEARLVAFKHRNLGRDAQLINEPADTSAEAAARTALCALIVVGVIGECYRSSIGPCTLFFGTSMRKTGSGDRIKLIIPATFPVTTRVNLTANVLLSD